MVRVGFGNRIDATAARIDHRISRRHAILRGCVRRNNVDGTGNIFQRLIMAPKHRTGNTHATEQPVKQMRLVEFFQQRFRLIEIAERRRVFVHALVSGTGHEQCLCFCFLVGMFDGQRARLQRRAQSIHRCPRDPVSARDEQQQFQPITCDRPRQTRFGLSERPGSIAVIETGFECGKIHG